jgi:hypothetical protein
MTKGDPVLITGSGGTGSRVNPTPESRGISLEDLT